MKRITKIILCTIVMLAMALPTVTMAKEATTTKQSTTQGVEAPMLLSVSFKNAKIEGSFEPSKFEYDLILDESGTTPTIENYKISKNAQVFVTNLNDTAQQQIGINVEIKNSNVSTNYVFRFANSTKVRVSSNNYLESFDCELGEVYPKLNEKDTDYSLYIPNDLTQLKLKATTKDVGATCSAPESIALNKDQNPVIEVTVTASDLSTRVYKFSVKRLSKNSSQVKAQMEEEGFTSLVKGELFYQKPEFRIAIISTATGLCFVIMLFFVLRRLTLKVDDPDEISVVDIELISSHKE